MNHGDDDMIEENFTDDESDNEADGTGEYTSYLYNLELAFCIHTHFYRY